MSPDTESLQVKVYMTKTMKLERDREELQQQMQTCPKGNELRVL